MYESQAYSLQRPGSVVYDRTFVINNVPRTWNSLRIRVCQPPHQIQYGELYIKRFLTFFCAMDLFERLVKPMDLLRKMYLNSLER